MLSDKLLHSSASGFGSRSAFARTDCSFFQAVSHRRLSATELPSVPTATTTTTTNATSPTFSLQSNSSSLSSSPPLILSAAEVAVCEFASDVMSKKTSSASAAGVVSASKKVDKKIVVSFNSDDSDEENTEEAVKTVTIKKGAKPPPSSEEEETSSSEAENSSSEDSSEEESEKEKSVDGEADVEDDDDMPTFTLTIQPSAASNPVDDALPDVVRSTPTSTTAPAAAIVTTTTNGKAVEAEESSEEEESEDEEVGEKVLKTVVKETQATVDGTIGNGKGKVEEEIVVEMVAKKGESKSHVIEEVKDVITSEQTVIETKEKKKSKRGNTSEITADQTEIIGDEAVEAVEAGKAVKKSSKSTRAEKITAVAAADQQEVAATGSIVEKVEVEKENGEESSESTAVELRNVEITHNPERRQSEIAFELVITESMIAEFEKNGTPFIQNVDDAAEAEPEDVSAEFTLASAVSNADEDSTTSKQMAEAIQTAVEKQEEAVTAAVQQSVVTSTAESSETVTEVIRKKTTKKSKVSKTTEVETEEQTENTTKTKAKKSSKRAAASEEDQSETVSVVSVDDAEDNSVKTASKGNLVERSGKIGQESVEETVAIVKVISTEILDEAKPVEVIATSVEKKEEKSAAAAAVGASVEGENGTTDVAPKEKKTKKTKASKLAEVKPEETSTVLESIPNEAKDVTTESEYSKVKYVDDVIADQSEIKTKEKSPATIKVESEKVDVLNTESSSEELGKVKAAFDLLDGKLGQSNGLAAEAAEVKTTSLISSGSAVEDSAGLIKDDVVDSNGVTGLANEESGYKVRRNSIDDFIKKILAEAREEQKKLLDSVASASPDAPKTNSGSATGTASDTMTSTGTAMVNGGTDLDADLTLGKSKFLSSTFSGGDSLLTNGFSSANGSTRKTAVEDIDSELADIGKYLTTRSRTKYDEFNDLENVQTTDMEGGISAIKMQSIAGMDEENAWRPFERREFTPQRREETSQLIQQSVRPVRALFDQQLNIIHNLKAAARQLDELDNEIREVLRKSTERRTFYETARNDLLEEARLYDTEQRTANERIDQQQLPGGRRFVREEFIRQCSAVDGRRPGWARSAAAAAEDSDASSGSFRRRSGSLSTASGTEDMSSRIQQLLRASGVDVTSRRSVEPDAIESSTMAAIAASRQRRAVSVLSERSYGASQDTDQQQSQRRGSISNNSSYRPSSNLTSTNDLYSSSTSSSRYGSYGGVSGYSSETPSSYYTSTVRSRAGSAAPSSDYLDDDEDFGGGTSSYSSSTMTSLTAKPLGTTGEVYYTYGADASSRPSASAYSSYGSSSTSSYTPRYQRSYSAAPEGTSSSPMSSSSLSSSYTSRRYASNASSGTTSAYGSSSAAGSGSGSDGGEFHSRFLEKVRQKKALGGTSSASSQPTSSSAASSSSADAGFRSRFLRTTGGDSGSSTTRNYDSYSSYSRP